MRKTSSTRLPLAAVLACGLTVDRLWGRLFHCGGGEPRPRLPGPQRLGRCCFQPPVTCGFAPPVLRLRPRAAQSTQRRQRRSCRQADHAHRVHRPRPALVRGPHQELQRDAPEHPGDDGRRAVGRDRPEAAAGLGDRAGPGPGDPELRPVGSIFQYIKTNSVRAADVSGRHRRHPDRVGGVPARRSRRPSRSTASSTRCRPTSRPWSSTTTRTCSPKAGIAAAPTTAGRLRRRREGADLAGRRPASPASTGSQPRRQPHHPDVADPAVDERRRHRRRQGLRGAQPTRPASRR